MGIHSDWVKTFKAEVPDAFTDTFRGRVKAGFIDGQIQLMKSRGVVSWDQFVQYQFVYPLRRLLREHGASVVVLAFDDYDHVPGAKGMTQAKRARRADPINFHAREQLPALIPDYWDRAIMNRNFKTRVIQLVIHKLPSLLGLAEHETLIVDYKGAPLAFRGGLDGEPLDGLEPTGEADLKFFRYADMYGSLLAVTTDSDYIPISLLRLESRAREARPEPLVVIQRLRVGDENGDARAAGVEVNKARPREFVNLNMLRAGLTATLVCMAHTAPEDGFWMARLCALVALFGGTDFSRGMPQVGPKRVWDVLHLVCCKLAASFDVGRGQLDEKATLNVFIARVYGAVFAAHACGRGIAAVMQSLARSKLSERTKQALPSPEYVDASIRNANWIVLYWGGDIRNEEDFGYRRDGNRFVYADQPLKRKQPEKS